MTTSSICNTCQTIPIDPTDVTTCDDCGSVICLWCWPWCDVCSTKLKIKIKNEDEK